MNAGMFPVPATANPRRLIARTGFDTGGNYPANDPLGHGIGIGLTAFAVSGVVAGQRRLVYSARGRGAARFLSVGLAAPASVRYELVIDGVTVVDFSKGSGVGGIALVGAIIGTAAPYCVTLDFVPFDSSFELYVTSNGTGNLSYTTLMDFFQ
jgi:hypothetical protein